MREKTQLDRRTPTRRDPNNRSITEAVETESAPSKYFFSALRPAPTPSEYLLNRPISCLF